MPAPATFNAKNRTDAIPKRDKETNQKFYFFRNHFFPQSFNRTSSAVKTKSRPNTASEDCTTVCVVAWLIPSEVGIAS